MEHSNPDTSPCGQEKKQTLGFQRYRVGSPMKPGSTCIREAECCRHETCMLVWCKFARTRAEAEKATAAGVMSYPRCFFHQGEGLPSIELLLSTQYSVRERTKERGQRPMSSNASLASSSGKESKQSSSSGPYGVPSRTCLWGMFKWIPKYLVSLVFVCACKLPDMA